jgi:hypothetical protein
VQQSSKLLRMCAWCACLVHASAKQNHTAGKNGLNCLHSVDQRD